MRGGVGGYILAASLGTGTARRHMEEVFGDDFQTPRGWHDMLNNLPGGRVENLMNRRGAWWTRQCFQALYVACWIHHPVEKGSYMIQLSPNHLANVRDAYSKLLDSGALQSRISSHLSKQGASAHEGWNFLKGYGELLLQIEGESSNAPALFLKCEGHALEKGLSMSTVKHLSSWVKKSVTGSGATASKALHDWASFSSVVEGRAAENFSKNYEKLLKQLGLSGRRTTVEEAVEALLSKAGMPGLPPQLKKNTIALGKAMLGPTGRLGYIALFKRRRAELKRKGVDFDDKAEYELTGLAERMTATSSSHEAQYYNEIHVTPADLDETLAAFRRFIP